jgi:peroxiredoxin
MPARNTIRSQAALCVSATTLAILAGLVVKVSRLGAAGDQVGEIRRAPMFQATDLQGNSVIVSLGQQRRSLLLFFCMCADCHRLARRLEQSPFVKDPVLEVVGVVHSTVEAVCGFRDQTAFPGLLLADPLDQVKRQYGGGPCPNAWLIDAGGSVFFHQKESICWSELSRKLDGWISTG